MVWFAFSAQDQVEKYGAYVGIAAFFGLAVLSLLYFSQARELKRLREWAGRAPERARELEQRVVAQATATVARRPASMPTATPAGAMAPPRRLAEMPAPETAAGAQATQLAEAVQAEPATNGNVPVPPVGPGGTVPAGPPLGPGGSVPAGAPANGAVSADATQVAPPPEGAPGNGAAAPAEGEPAQAADREAAGAGAAAAGAAAAATPAPADRTDEGEAAVPGEIPPAPAVPRVTPAQRVGVTPRPEPMPLRQAQPSATPRGGGRRPGAPAGRRPGTAAKPPREGRSAGTIALLVGLAVLILGGGTWGVSQLLGGDETPSPPNQPAPPATQTQEPGSGGGNQPAEPSPPGETNVAVLNGTTSTGLAGTIADQLTAQGYVRDVVETNTRDQTIQETVVYYADGERATARAVARILKVDTIEPLDPETESLAPEADIVVLAGADQAP